jgi:branched-subunit amino acid ABC-type transport system permease component
MVGAYTAWFAQQYLHWDLYSAFALAVVVCTLLGVIFYQGLVPTRATLPYRHAHRYAGLRAASLRS